MDCQYSYVIIFLLLLSPVGALGQPRPLSPCEWETDQREAHKRAEALSATIAGKLYVFSGFTDSLKILRSCTRYDPGNETWTSLAPMPLPVTHAGVVVVDREVWILGGFAGDHPGTAVTRVQIYDAVRDRWRIGPNLPYRRASLAAAKLGRTLHVFGGLTRDRQTDVGTHWVYDLEQPEVGWVEAAPMPVPRNHHSGAGVGGKIYAIGGQQGHDRSVRDLAVLHEYNPVSDTWVRRSDLPFARSHFEPGTFAVDGKIYIVGGRTLKHYFSHITVYDPATNVWAEKCPLPFRLMAPVARVIDSSIVVGYGGLNSWKRPTNWIGRSPFFRNRRRTFRFQRDSLFIRANQSPRTETKEVLWTLSDTAHFKLNQAALPSWLQLTAYSNQASISGERITLRADRRGLPLGRYETTIIASAPGYDDARLTVVFSVAEPADHVTTGQDTLTEVVTGLNISSLLPSFKVYPNSFKDYLILEGTLLSDDCQLLLVALSGKSYPLDYRLMDKPSHFHKYVVRISSQLLASGMYLLVVRRRGKVLAQSRIMKQ